MEVFLTDPGQSHVLNTAPLRKTLVHEFAAHKFLRRIGLGLIAAIGYYLGTKLGFLLPPHETLISPLWPPNAILLAILLLVPKRDWWVPISAVLPIHLLIQLKLGIPVATSIGWFIGNTGEALLGAALICRFVHPRRMFESVRGTVIFLGFAVVMAPLTTSFMDAASVTITGWGEHFWSLWGARLFSNSLAELIVVPTILTFWISGTRWIKQATRARYLEASALGMGLVIISVLVFDFDRANSLNSRALIYVPF